MQSERCVSRFEGKGSDLEVYGLTGNGRVKRMVGGAGCSGVGFGRRRSNILKAKRECECEAKRKVRGVDDLRRKKMRSRMCDIRSIGDSV